MRSGGRERGLLRLELRRVEVRGLALGRMTWRQQAGGSPSADAANGLGVGAFALQRKVRRRGNGACSALAPRRIEDEEFASRATSGSGRIEVRLAPRLQTDRGGELASMSKIRRRKDRSLLRFEVANGSRRGVRFSSKVRRAEGSGFASILRFAKRVRQDRGFARRLRRVLAEWRSELAPDRRTAKALVPGEHSLSERAPGGEERTFASASNRPRGTRKGPGLSADPGDGETGCFGAPGANLFEAARGESCCDASETGNGHPGLGLARTRREPPRPHGLDGTHGDHPAASASERCPPTQRVIASPRRGIVRLGHWGLAATPAPILVLAGIGGQVLVRRTDLRGAPNSEGWPSSGC
jgi:hypothetical protein